MPEPSNSLLASLSAGDAAALKPYLRHVKLEHKQVLFEAGDPISLVYFPTTSVISLVVALSSGEMIEAAMVGRDGIVGAAAALDGKISLSLAIVQLPGNAVSCSVDALATAAFQSRRLISTLVRHEQTVYAQAQQSAACMATHDVQARFCRWLLRARDLSQSDTLPFTQEFLAEMMGVRRTSVSPVAHTLQQAGMIRYARGRIEVLNVEALRETACECYDAIKSNYGKLLDEPLGNPESL
jgi:CRP-like cAMP-binding protein